ncbi:MAG TPA: hypothetical protein VFS07_04695 [Gemmatimonadales bacterium]|nr:hypothetical protein [Gemmatimonadales bacterium]
MRGALLLLALGSVPAAAQVRREAGLQVTALFPADAAVAPMAAGALRTSRRVRFSVAAGPRWADGTTGGRGEALAAFLLAPGHRGGWGPYAAGGVAVDVAHGAEAWLVALLGVEQAPGAPQGIFVEAGWGGGARVALGWRRRW